MITLRPPFRAENMEGLYNKVIKGQFSKIPEKFSNDLVELVKYLIQVQPENRPSPGKLILIDFYFRPNFKKSNHSKKNGIF